MASKRTWSHPSAQHAVHDLLRDAGARPEAEPERLEPHGRREEDHPADRQPGGDGVGAGRGAEGVRHQPLHRPEERRGPLQRGGEMDQRGDAAGGLAVPRQIERHHPETRRHGRIDERRHLAGVAAPTVHQQQGRPLPPGAADHLPALDFEGEDVAARQHLPLLVAQARPPRREEELAREERGGPRRQRARHPQASAQPGGDRHGA
jgi:hypothetical protein